MPKLKIKKCKQCGKEFEQSPKARFERKYCKNAVRKEKRIMRDYGKSL